MISLLQRYVFHDFWLKLLSLLLAAGLWYMISHEEQAEVALRSPVVLQNVPRHLEISSESIPEAQIRVRGPERIIRQLQADEVRAELDLADAKPGERTFDLTSQQVRHPRDVAVVQVVPSQLRLAFDARLTREVEIHPRVIPPADGEQITFAVDPPRITITGPRGHVEEVDAAKTDPVDASAIRTNTVFTTNAYVGDPLVQVVEPTSVRVTVILQKAGNAPAR